MTLRHRVYLPGPFAQTGPSIVAHPPDCPGSPCPVGIAMAEWVAVHRVYQVQGDYFTEDGLRFERCAFQPGAPR